MTTRVYGPTEALSPVLGVSGDLLFCLDLDGTLATVTERPELASMSPELTETVRSLAAVPAVTVAVVSGRSAADLRQRFGEKVICAGCHGLEIAGPGLEFVQEDALHLAAVVDQAAWDLEAAVLNLPGVFVERKGLCATLRYRQAQPYLAGWLQSTVEWVLAPYRGLLRISRGRQAYEIRPCVEWNKGSALRYLVERSHQAAPFVICAGDDWSGGDLLAAGDRGMSISVVSLEPAEFAEFLLAVHLTLSRRRAAGPRSEAG